MLAVSMYERYADSAVVLIKRICECCIDVNRKYPRVLCRY
jgi:hypothetical protein